MSRTGRVTKAKRRPPKTPGVMNATEKRFEANVLKPMLWSEEIVDYQYEPAKWRFGTDFKATYTPDFMVQMADGTIEMIDVKGSGGWEQHTRVKIKACAEKYPAFSWVGFTEQRGSKNRGRFDREEF